MTWIERIPDNLVSKLIQPSGPIDAKILIVGEAPGEEEVSKGYPFAGRAGYELNQQLTEAGINRHACRITNVSLERPPGNKFRKHFYDRLTKPIRYVPTQRLLQWHKILEEQVLEMDPDIIVALGNEALFALVGYKDITKRRGSIYYSKTGHKTIAMVHPAAVNRKFRWRQVCIHDWVRVKQESKSREITQPNQTYVISPEFLQAQSALEEILRKKEPIVIDLETRAGHIACIGIATSPTEAICIPFMRSTSHYWKEENETALLFLILKILHEVPIIGQNLMVFDCAYFWNEWSARIQRLEMDTMHAHHVAYIEGPTSHALHYLCSIYTDPVMPYYKDEGKVWERGMGEEQFWEYCCKDCTATYQAYIGIQEELDEMKLSDFYHDYVKPLSFVLQDLQFQGMLVDSKARADLTESNERSLVFLQYCLDQAIQRATEDDIVSLNVKSDKQMKHFLYDELGLKRQFKGSGAGRTVTCNEDALHALKKEAKTTLLFDTILAVRELRKENEFLATPIPSSGRMNTALKVSGTETGRLASSADAFDSGTNLQNVKHKLRRIFIADPGKDLYEIDSSQAEARVVAVLAEQWDLVQMYEDGVDVHWENAKRIFGLQHQLRYDTNNKEQYRMRYLAKRTVHASNYGMSWMKLQTLLLTEASIDLSKAEAEDLLERPHKIYPKIRAVYHESVRAQLAKDRTLITPYGRVRVFHDRWPRKGSGDLFRKAFAYIPQSTVGDLVNRALLDFHSWCKDPMNMGIAEILTQVHDSIVFQAQQLYCWHAINCLKALMERPVNIDGYDLVIPTDVAIGKNWGPYSSDNPNGMMEMYTHGGN